MRQYRGCSKLYYAVITEDAQGNVTYGTPKQLAPVKSVSRDISSENEPVYADNVVQQRTYGATSVTRTFETTRIAPEVVAELLGASTIELANEKGKMYLTSPTGATRPHIALMYALHDGDDVPCELVVAWNCMVNSISKASNTIDDGTGSEGQSVEVVSVAPKKAWEKTGKRELDASYPIDATNQSLVDKFFAQVVTPDNADEVLA